MDDNYCTPLAAILRKAQGCIYRGTDEFIDVGGEVSELRRICDSQRATISRLRAELTEARKPDCRMCSYFMPRVRACCVPGIDCNNGDRFEDIFNTEPVRLYEKEGKV